MTEKWSQLGATLWDESVPIAGTPAEAYLRGRGITSLPGPEVLRFHPAVQHLKLKRKLPALIAQVTGGVEPSHNFTWLSADGAGKADTEKAEQRRTLGSSKGGAVRLAEPIDGKPLIVGEGIETTATAMEATGLPGWASLGTSGLGNIEWPGDVREVILLAENDENGANQRALDKVCPVLAGQGLKVRVATPPAGFGDFNDLVDPNKEGGGPGGLVIAKMIIEARRNGGRSATRAQTHRRRNKHHKLPSLSISPRPAAIFSAIQPTKLTLASSPRTQRASIEKRTDSVPRASICG